MGTSDWGRPIVGAGSVPVMLVYLSPAWVAALDHAARADPALADAAREVGLVVEQHVTGGPQGDVIYHLVFDHGAVSVASGAADDGPSAVVRFTLDHETALAIARGEGSAQRAFMAGSLQVGGDLRALIDHQAVLSALHDVFAAVRDQTDLGPVSATEEGG
jgi:hypothetical protein